jgi:hypothetical protein
MATGTVGFRFDPEWRITLFTLVMVSVMVNLGFWQLQREEEKAELSLAWEQRQAQPPAPLEELWHDGLDQLAYRPVTVTGRYREGEYFLLDNRILKGKFGYEVLALMELEDSGDTVLVNRGWIAGDPARLSQPVIPEIAGLVTERGHVYVAPGEAYLLQEQQLAPGWPKLAGLAEVVTGGGNGQDNRRSWCRAAFPSPGEAGRRSTGSPGDRLESGECESREAPGICCPVVHNGDGGGTDRFLLPALQQCLAIADRA